jgi:hypothetical protein
MHPVRLPLRPMHATSEFEIEQGSGTMKCSQNSTIDPDSTSGCCVWHRIREWRLCSGERADRDLDFKFSDEDEVLFWQRRRGGDSARPDYWQTPILPERSTVQARPPSGSLVLLMSP